MTDDVPTALDLGSWRSQVVTEEVYVDPAPVAALQALLDTSSPRVSVGDLLPPLWHWVALPQWHTSSQLGADGHPRTGGFLPPLPYRRRMWAGGELRLHHPLVVGAMVRRESEVLAIEAKHGRSGPLIVVTVEIRLRTSDGQVAVEEQQNLIYREMTSAPAAPSAAAPGAGPAATDPGAPLGRAAPSASGEPRPGVWDMRTDPSLLMRFSAATANAHRIHYDWPYATQIEGYPGLVVHGPLMTLCLAEVIRLERPAAAIVRLRHRNLAPLVCGQPAQLRLVDRTPDASEEELGVDLVAADSIRSSLTVTLQA